MATGTAAAADRGAGLGDLAPKVRLLATLGALAGGAIWGVFWWPVRTLGEAGFAGLWPVAALYGVGAALLLPLGILRRRRLAAAGWHLHLAGLLAGGGMAAYAAAFLHTEIVPAVLLYYLSPVWGFLLARLVFRDPITPLRWAAMAMALAGAGVVLGPGSWPPMPRNAGDWMALGAGAAFVAGSTLMLSRPRVAPADYTLAFFAWAALGTAAIAVLQGTPFPAAALWRAEAGWLVPFVALLVAPGCYAAIYGAARLNPGLVAILYMAEIGVALALAAVLTDERIGPAQIAGVALITAAGAVEPAAVLLRRWRDRASRPATRA